MCGYKKLRESLKNNNGMYKFQSNRFFKGKMMEQRKFNQPKKNQEWEEK